MKIREVTLYDELVSLFIRNELEFSKEEPVSTDIICGWEARDDGKLAGGCVLAMRQGEYIIDGIAVDLEYRNSDLGTQLLNTAMNRCKELGGKEIFLVARAPGFFKKNGFLSIERDKSPYFFECFTCSQYNVTCFPQVMRRNIVEL